MLPRFVNPHLLIPSTVSVSRKDVFLDVDEIEASKAPRDPQTNSLIVQLNQIILTSLEPNSNLEKEPSDRRKRRKIVSEGATEPLLFRLVSRSLPPQRILLEPKPLPSPVTREPDCEDSEEQAALRERQARAMAVDFSWIIGESVKRAHSQPQKLFHANASLPHPTPVIVIIQRDQPKRRTRPPVPASQLTHHPYAHDASPMPTENTTSKNCPRIDVTFPSLSDPPTRARRQRRKRGKMPVKDRPLPAFWRPNPACRGKGLGYAMGYPYSSGEDWDGSSRYRRDTMRKGVHVDSVA